MCIITLFFQIWRPRIHWPSAFNVIYKNFGYTETTTDLIYQGNTNLTKTELNSIMRLINIKSFKCKYYKLISCWPTYINSVLLTEKAKDFIWFYYGLQQCKQCFSFSTIMVVRGCLLRRHSYALYLGILHS